MRNTFEGQHVVVTGAGSGIGRSAAHEFARRGATVSVVDIDAARTGATVGHLVATGAPAHGFVVDVARPSEVAALAARLEAVAPVDVLVNNAGVAVVAPFASTEPADLEWVMGVNVWGPLRLTHALLPAMLRRGRGHVVVVASLAGLLGAPGMVAYSTTKFAAVGFAEALRIEVEKEGIGVTAVCPGYVRTDFHRSTRYGNDPFRAFLDHAPSLYGLSSDGVGRALVDAVERRERLVVLGPEKLGWWLKRLAPTLAHRVAAFLSDRMGIAGSGKDAACTPS